MINKPRGYEFRFQHYIHDRKRWDNRESKYPERKQTPPIKIILKTKRGCGKEVLSILRNKKYLEKKHNATLKVQWTREERNEYQREYARKIKKQKQLAKKYRIARKKKIIKEELWQRNKR